ncbi:LOW QUALITY PROTEIN: hypothetical protein RJ641_019120 [Dillenia turbinata]|uniref:Uncharacterized protein n=1 Tax=Dillenia turbinata TaxID=194707 RepID=A0AAN8YV54_9MAGN
MQLGFRKSQGIECDVKAWKRRCTVLFDRIASLPLSKIPESSKLTLLRLASSELSFLLRLGHQSCRVDGIFGQKLVEEFGACGVGSEISLLGYDFFGGVDSSLSDVARLENGVRDDSHLDTVKQELLERSDEGTSFLSLASEMKSCSLDVEDVEVDKPEDLQADLINFDTTALIALVLGISNCGTEKLFATPEIELRQRFKSNYEFVIAQVMSEIQNQCIQNCIVLFLRSIICASVLSEFKELVSMRGGPNEKLRAD